MAEIPKGSNFFSSLHTVLSREDVAGIYSALGWQIRKCSWTDYEISNNWAELLIAGESPILMHGTVANLPARAEELVAPLRSASLSFTAECYGPNGELLLEIKSSVHSQPTSSINKRSE